MYYPQDDDATGAATQPADRTSAKVEVDSGRDLRATAAQLHDYVTRNRRFAGSEYQPASTKNWWLP